MGARLRSADDRMSLSVLILPWDIRYIWKDIEWEHTERDDHSTRGSCAKASRTLIRESLFDLRMLIVISAALRKTPALVSPVPVHGLPLTFDTGDTQGIHHVVSKPEWNLLRYLKCFALM